ncbi:MAG: hypothetical protein M3O87_07470 [Candidatus Dormibacteraeota bacterium]|nr:hypothetical protein [Candidatus Dormibacteraeota bacterium]
MLLTLLVVAAAIVVAGARPAHAASCVVDDNGDAPAANAATNCLTAGGNVTLRSAIQHFNSVGGTNVITFSIPTGSQVTLTNGVLPVNNSQNLTITAGTTPGSIIVDGNNAGGGFNVAGGTTLTFSGLTLQHTTTNGVGGAIDNSGTVVISNSSLSNNTTTANGGAIENRTGSITMTDSIIANNTATGAGILGAGIRSFSFGSGVVNLTRVTVSGNQLPGAGANGAGVELSGAGTYNFVNVTLSGNSAAGDGGGLLLENGAQLTATNLTLSNNAATAGAGIEKAALSGATVVNTIVSGNKPDNCAGPGTITSTGHNLELGTSCGFTQTTDINADPQLGALALNPPGFLQTHSLAATSPAVDKGDTTTCPATDERGVQRKLDGVCDIGAFEFIAAAVTPASVVPGLPPSGAPGRPQVPWQEIALALTVAGVAAVGAVGIWRWLPGRF